VNRNENHNESFRQVIMLRKHEWSAVRSDRTSYAGVKALRAAGAIHGLH